jgi:hypothetical protein
MAKKRFVAASIVLALLTILAPSPSHASAWIPAPHFGSAAGFFAKVETWWNLLLNGPDSGFRAEPSSPAKNGCGMDPTGHVVCDPDPPGQATAPPPADPDL